MSNKSLQILQIKLLAPIITGLAVASLMLCGNATQAQVTITGIFPNGAYQFQATNTLSFTASSSAGINSANITVQLTATSLPGQSFTSNLTGVNGLTVMGTSTSRIVSAPLTSNTVYTAVIQVTDANNNVTSTNVSFDTISPAYTFEAEDYNYNGGNFHDNPQTNAYAGLNATEGVDTHNTDFSGGGSAYRPSGLNTEVNGDIPRLAYVGTGKTDYDVGWNNAGSGNWGNYTRTFPTGSYNVYMRAANPNSFTADSASMSGAATGTFSVPDTGNWQTYTWVPLRDSNGNLARFVGGSMETLRVTTDNGNYNANSYLLMPLNTNAPVISDVYPNGSSFFQYTNTFSFVASSPAGILTNSIAVTLDGVNVSGLVFSGSPTSWNVSCPLQVNTNHTAVITVTDGNGSVATTTVNFNDFQSSDYQLEAEDYDYTSNGIAGQFFDSPQVDAYAGLPSTAGVDNYQFDLSASPFDYRANSIGACPSTSPAGDGQRFQFVAGKTDYDIGFFGGGSWCDYTRHYPAGTYNVWGRFAEDSATTEATLSQVTNGYGTANQSINFLGTFFIPFSGGGQTWEWAPLKDGNGNLITVKFDGSQTALQLGGTPVGGQPEVNVNFLMLVPTAPVALTVVQAVNIGTTNVEIFYSTPVEAASATNIANYVFTSGLTVTGASLNADNKTVVLTTAPLTYGSNYSVVINGVRDRLNLPDTIAANTTASFFVSPFVSHDIGSLPEPSVVTTVNNGIDVTVEANNVGGSADQMNLEYELRTGDFDVSVRVAGLSPSDVWAKAGLMARETLDPGSRFAASITTPAMNGCFFEWRDPASSTASTAGNFPANYPNTWLRLKRAGNTFTGFASYDGQTWTQLGSDTITMSNQVYLGFAVSSDNTNQPTTAQFLDEADVNANTNIGTIFNPHDAIGPSSRTTPIAISEIMYKPAPRMDGKNLEFIEIYNSNPWFQDISGYQITCADMNYTFPPNTTIAGGSYLVIAAAPADIESVYGITNVMGSYNGSLKKSETLQLLDERTNVLLTVPYSNIYPWPVAANGTGHSIVLANPTYGEGDSRAWDISDVVGGSPGQMDGFTPSPLRNVVINEILPHSENPAVPQFIELYNHSTNSVDVSGCILTDDPTTNKFVIPDGTVIPPAGFVSFTQSQFNFTLNGAGGTLYFIKPDGSRVLDAVQYNAQPDGVSYGRWPDGANDFYNFTANTPGTNNSSILIGDIVINELMYDPISGNDDDQYIELYNKGTNTVNLAGWQFTSGVSFIFPNVSIAPNGYLVVARNMTNLFAKYPNLNSGNTVGNYGGKLSHNGELVALAQPETLYTNTPILVAEDQVTYGTGGRWGEWSGGGGSSLELIDPRANHRLASNWADSDETSKSVWTDIETTGVLDNGANYESGIQHTQIGLLDEGECLVDNIEVDYNSVNYVSNGTFESGTNGWSFQGAMSRSSLENSGYNSSYSLHIRSSDKVWTGDNSCQVSLNANSLAAGQTVTLRFKARWLHGWPEALLRLNGNWLEAAGALPVPENLGSPGMPNSQYVTNAGPAIYNVTHNPPVPAANQAAVVTAQVHDPDGVQNLTLYYRIDPAATYTAVPMNDGGTNGDAVPRDGIFSATIPGQTAGKLAAFYISATDGNSAVTRFPSLLTDNSPTRECLVMFGDGNPGGSFGVYHLWITQSNATRWANLGNLSNEGNDCTFVNGNRVIYNMQARFAGSPYHQDYTGPYNALCNYKWEFNDDDQFLGATDFNKIHQPGNGAGDDASLQREQLANTFLRALGVPWLNRRYVVVYVNGNQRGDLMEDAQCPGSDIVKEHWPNDDDGFLYKMQPWFEFAPQLSSDTLGFDNQSWCTLNNYTTTGGVKKMARYRYDYETRRTPDSDNDYTNVYSLINAANSYGTLNYVANMENIADMENWMRVFAANHAAGNWDSFGAENGQNLYGYIGTQGTKYSLLMWDFNIVIGNSGSWTPGENLFYVNPADPYMTDIYNTPVFRRMYWRALQELVNSPLNVANSGPLLMAKYNAFVANGFSGVENPSANIEPWLSQAQSSIASQLAAVNATSFTVNPTVTVSNNVAYVTGGAPVNVDTIWINGVAYPLTWTSLTSWSVAFPLAKGTNNLSVTGIDHNGQPIAGDSGGVNVVYNGTNASPVGQVVINEIMYDPAIPNAQFVELYNNSTNQTFDLSGWQLQGLSYTFPNGSIIGPTNYLVLAQNDAAFAAAYGATHPVFDTFDGTLQPGQILSLVQPDGNGTNNLVVTEVQYDSVLPWPTNVSGSSLQLIDSAQDNWRVGNWAVVQTVNFASTPAAINSVATALPTFPSLWINEVQADNMTGITNSAGQHAPWLELYNPSTNVISLNGLYLANNYTNLTQWAFPANTSINPGQFKVIFADSETNLSTTNELHTSFTLSSDSGSVALSRLYNSQPQVLDYLNYNNIGVDHSYGSFPDGQSFNRQEFFYATPGTTNNGAVPLTVSINEWMAGNTSTLQDPLDSNKYDDWFELYNYGDITVNLAGCYLTNAVSSDVGLASQIPSGYTIPPHGFLLVWADKKTPTGSGDLHTDFKLSKSGTSIALYDSNQNLVDDVTFGAQSDNISQGRYPDGSTNIVFMVVPTPRTNNIYNTAPVLAAISNAVLTLGQTLMFTASATDSDQPPQTLTFSLGEGAPSGASITSGGLFTWTPANAPSTNSISVIVTDNGTPNLSASQTFTVTVYLPPQLGSASISGNQFTLSWQTVAGQNYQIEYKDNLNAPTWTPLGSAISGTGGLVSVTNSLTSPAQRFFRIVLQ